MNAFSLIAVLLVSPQPGAPDTVCPAISPAGVEAQFERFNAAWATRPLRGATGTFPAATPCNPFPL